MPIKSKDKHQRSKLRVKEGLSGMLLVSFLLIAGTVHAGDETKSGSLKRARRIEFDERLIMGQSLKSGAVYLFERKDSEIQSMLKIRKDFRKELLAPLEPSY